MGGKSQQRVAGNVKPANSRRARELLISKQHDISNIITFSALSNANNSRNSLDDRGQQAPLEVRQDKNEHACEDTNKVTSILKSQSKPSLDETSRPKLVVRKVDGRDCFSRVTFSEDTNFSSDIIPKKCGVFLPPSDSSEYSTIDTKEQTDYSEHDAKEKGSEADEASESDSTDDLEEYKDDAVEGSLEFDTILDRIDDSNNKLALQPINSIADIDDNRVQNEINLLDSLKLMLKNFYKDLSIVEWDMIIKNLQKWIEWSMTIISSQSSTINNKQFELVNKSLDFINQLITLANFLKGNKKTEVNDNDFIMLNVILDGWDDFYTSPIFQSLIVLFFKTLRSTRDRVDEERTKRIRPFIRKMSQIIISVDHKSVVSIADILHRLDSDQALDPGYKLPAHSLFCQLDEKKFSGFTAICQLLSNNNREVVIAAHSMLKKSMREVCAASALSMATLDDLNTVEDLPIFPPKALMFTLTSKDSIMTALLSDYREGDISVTIDPKTDSYTCTLSYLFIWDLVIDYIVEASKELSCRIIHSLKKIGLIQRLMDNIVVLFPPLTERNPMNLKYKERKRGRSGTSKDNLLPQDWSLSNYLKNPLATTIERPLNEIELTAIHLYYSIALHMPVTVRKWYNNNPNKRLCNLVNEYTVKHISPVICSIEMESVQTKCRERASLLEVDNLVIKARPSAKEVYAIYTRDEFKMELTIKLPLNYPLGSVQIDGGKRVGVTDVKWRSWLLQLTTFLSHQNGPILDGIDLWRRNIDKRFEGVEKCTICYSILHSNYQLPKKKCQTCANMFHNMCLYKWFESSGNTTCPLCRSPW